MKLRLFSKVRSAFVVGKKYILSQRMGFSPDAIYKEEFVLGGGFSKTERSARVICKWIRDSINPKTVLDLGSGPGYYLREFKKLGIIAIGLEGSLTAIKLCGPEVLAFSYDLRRPFYISYQFDLVMCIEVAEHIPKRFSSVLVHSICGAAKNYVLFTSAPPGTPGTDHINCRPWNFWEQLFMTHGFICDKELTQEMRTVAQREDLAEWWKSWSWCLKRKST